MAQTVICLPDWAEERHLYVVMAGIEPVAIKHAGSSCWQVKTSRCSQCGECCSTLRNSDEFPQVIDGRCVYLENQGNLKVCSLGLQRPFSCSISTPSREGCTVKYEAVGNGS